MMMKRYICLLALSTAAACNDEITGLEPPSDPATETFAPSLGIDISQMTRTEKGVYILDVLVGAGGEVVADTDSVRITYRGFLKDGTLFDSGVNVRFVPLNLVEGFSSGMLGMKEGGRRKIVIPSALGFGGRSITQGQVKIPRQSTLVFEVDLLTAFNSADEP